MDMDTCRFEAVAVGSLIAAQFVPQSGDSFLAYSKSAQISPILSKGKYRELREETMVAALKQDPDLLLGYDITLTDVCLNPRAFAAADGGTVLVKEHLFSDYLAPAARMNVSRVPFTLCLYAPQKDENGEDAGYLQLSFSRCTGSPASLTLAQGAFFLTTYTIQSRPCNSEDSMKITWLSSLPFERV